MKLALVTKSAWKDLPERVSALAKSLSAQLPETVEISIVLKDHGDIPSDKNGRIAAAFLDKTLSVGKEYDGACLLVSLSDRKRFKLKDTLRGHYHRDEDGFAEFWVASDRRTTRKGKPQFEETFAHELCHGLYHQLGVPKTTDETRHLPGHDNTHYFHDVKGSPAGALKELSALWPKPRKAPKSSATLDGLTPKMRLVAERTVRAMAELGKPVRVTEGYRSNERQAQLYAQGRTAPGPILTNAKPGQSKHNTGEACDFVFVRGGYNVPEADWQLLGMMAGSFGGKWGGKWKGFPDRPHVEV